MVQAGGALLIQYGKSWFRDPLEQKNVFTSEVHNRFGFRQTPKLRTDFPCTSGEGCTEGVEFLSFFASYLASWDIPECWANWDVRYLSAFHIQKLPPSPP